jgi:hypothetical protein
MMQYRVDTARCAIKGDKPILDTQQDVPQTSVCDVTEFCYGTRWAEIPTLRQQEMLMSPQCSAISG